MKKTIFKNYEEMSTAAANIVAAAIGAKPNIVLGLPTGSTPCGMYSNLVAMHKAGKLDFSQVKSFNLDEYVGLQENHNQSYRFFMQTQLFNHVNILPQNTYVPSGTAKNLEEAAALFDKKIEEEGGIDLFVLGIGANGHIGFNEPAASMPAYTHVVDLTKQTIEDNARAFFGGNMKAVPKKAITQGLATILQAKKIILLASGKSKAAAIESIDKKILTLNCPATMLHLHNNVELLVCN